MYVKRKKRHLEECGVCEMFKHLFLIILYKTILFCGARNLEMRALLCFMHVSCVSRIRVWCVSCVSNVCYGS